MKPHVLRARQGRRRWWIVASWSNVLLGFAGESLDAVLRRWEKRYGRPREGYNRVVGIVNLYETGCRLGLLWRDTPSPAKGGAR